MRQYDDVTFLHETYNTKELQLLLLAVCKGVLETEKQAHVLIRPGL